MDLSHVFWNRSGRKHSARRKMWLQTSRTLASRINLVLSLARRTERIDPIVWGSFQRCCFSTAAVRFKDGPESKSSPVSFATLLRSSPLVRLGLPQGKHVVGTIVDAVGDDLYIDFGFKFNAVCRRPKQNGR